MGWDRTYLFVGRENGKASAGRLVLVRSPEGPESNWSTTELGEPALQFGLGGVVGQAAHVKNLAALGKESPDVGTSIHGPGEDVGVVLWGLRLADQAAKDTSEGDGLLHGASGRGRSKSLQVEGQVVLDGSRGLDGFNLKGGTDVSEGAGAKGQRLGVVCLPALVLGTQVEGARVLQIGREDDGLVSCLTRQLDTQVPGVKGDKGKLVVVCEQVLLGEGIESVDCIAEGTSIADVLPGQGGEACCSAMSGQPSCVMVTIECNIVRQPGSWGNEGKEGRRAGGKEGKRGTRGREGATNCIAG